MGSGQVGWLGQTRLAWIDYETTGIQDVGDLPIEVGIIITDCAMNRLDSYTSLINWPTFEPMACWPPAWHGAYAIHGISVGEVKREGRRAVTVAQDVYNLAEKHRPTDGRVVLVSDNVQFEWKYTKLLLEQLRDDRPWPFHYCGWDTSILGIVPGLNFVDPVMPAHRAMSDAEGMLDAVQQVTGVGWDPYLKLWSAKPHHNPMYWALELCTCGHPYERHFDGYDNMAVVGCKYCQCLHHTPAG